MEQLFDDIKKQFDIKDMDLKTYSPLTLAYIGDAVYEIIIRTIVVAKGNSNVNSLHKRSTALVKASAQAALIKALLDELTDAEMSIYKRGRNAKSYSAAKNATLSDYRLATGFETLSGYLYMDNQMERLMELVRIGVERTEWKKN